MAICLVDQATETEELDDDVMFGPDFNREAVWKSFEQETPGAAREETAAAAKTDAGGMATAEAGAEAAAAENADENDGEGEGDDLDQQGDEARPSRRKPSRVPGRPPSAAEIREHERTHLPYRSWCRFCIAARAPGRHHRRAPAGGERDGDEHGGQARSINGLLLLAKCGLIRI